MPGILKSSRARRCRPGAKTFGALRPSKAVSPRSERIQLQASCRTGAGRTGILWAGKVRNISPNGIGLLLPRSFSAGTVLTVKLHHDQGPILMTLSVRVIFVRLDASGSFHGCQFFHCLSDERERQSKLCLWRIGLPSKFAPLPVKVPDTGDGLYRENHIMRYPQTAMVISSDLGSGIHPVNKSGYGECAACVALGMVYGRKVEFYGPIYEAHKVEGNKVRITFSHLGQGLADRLQGFAVAGEDKVFHWAEAAVDGDSVVVSCDKVAKPVAVRYAWSKDHPWANLFNRDGLPAIPFRTDSW
jgi:hypothetical protein